MNAFSGSLCFLHHTPRRILLKEATSPQALQETSFARPDVPTNDNLRRSAMAARRLLPFRMPSRVLVRQK